MITALITYIVGACLYAVALIGLVAFTGTGEGVKAQHVIAGAVAVLLWPLALGIQAGMLLMFAWEARNTPQ